MKRFLLRMNPFQAAGMAFVGLALVVLALWYVYFSRAKDRVYPLRLSTGRVISPPKRLTTFFLDRSGGHGVEFQLISTEGSDDSLVRIERGELDLAVVKGGILLDKNTQVRQVATLDIEAFHLLVKEPIFAAWEQNFSALSGKRININKPSTGTHHWSLDILHFAGLTPTTQDNKGNFTPVMLGNPELLAILAGLRNASDAQSRPSTRRAS